MLEVLEKEQKHHLQVLGQIQKSNLYEIEKLGLGYAKVIFRLDNAQTIDDNKTVFEAELFRVANFTALSAVNETQTFVLNVNIEFLSQVDIDSKEIVFEAKAVSSSLGKRFVEVRAKVNDITIFLGNFTVLKMDGRSKIKL